MPLTLKLQLILSDDDLDVIEHQVIDHPAKKKGERVGEAWARHAFHTLGVNGPAAVVAKVQRWRPEYEKAKAEQGKSYKNAAAREIDRLAEEKTRQQAVQKPVPKHANKRRRS